jgi:bacterioferritin
MERRDTDGRDQRPKEAQILTLARSHQNIAPTEVVGPRSALVGELTAAYWHELEGVTSHLASSTNREGVHAERIAGSIHQVIADDLKHAQQVALRIRRLHGVPPRPDEFAAQNLLLQPPAEPLDNVSALAGLIEAQTTAIERYRRIAALAPKACDWVTQALAHRIMREKEICRTSLASLLALEQ